MTSGEQPEYRPKIFTKIEQVRKWRISCILDNKTVGFVPTMGALHEGHLSLMQKSLDSNDSTIISIFVNPSQFAPTEDLGLYPRTVEKDIELASSISGTFNKLQTRVDAVFLPQVDEMYPSGIPLDVSSQKGAFVSVLGLSEVLEGRTRPNFFRGVATVVSKFFIIVNPTRAYFGEKDYQQAQVIKQLVKDLLFDIEIVVCPLHREASGLALSSRNKYLDNRSKEVALNVSRLLSLAKKLYVEQNVYSSAELIAAMTSFLKPWVASGEMSIDYISVNDKNTLEELQNINRDLGAVISCAIYVTNQSDNITTRLIDNIVL